MYHARKDRIDIINNLPHGAMKIIAKEVGCSIVQVSHVLHGRRRDYNEIIKKAELMAAINIWKTRFCKFKSEL